MDQPTLTVPDAVPVPDAAPALAAGVSLLGEYQGSGFTEPHYLIVRGDQQVLHVSRLLFLVAAAVDGESRLEEVARRVSADYGRTLTDDGVAYLVEEKLRPMGVVAEAVVPRGIPATPAMSGTVVETETPVEARRLPRANPLLALRFRGTLVPARVTRGLAAFLAPMFFTPTVILAVVSLVGVDAWLVGLADVPSAFGAVNVDPPLLLAVIGILLVSTLLHELGHAAACRAGGANPGVIGVAVYVVYPAFFTDVTDSYRLGRAGRVRTDLGGVYLNALSVIGLALVYARTSSAAVLLAIILIHVEMVQQLLPLGRLDGYFILADLVGVPDLFGRIGPVLASLLPWRSAHPRVLELRRSARAVITLWVVVVVPVMAGLLGAMLWSAPSIVRQTAESMTRQWATLRTATEYLEDLDLASALLSMLSLVLLPLPLVGLTWLVGGALRRVVTALWRAGHRLPAGSPRVSGPIPPHPKETPMPGRPTPLVEARPRPTSATLTEPFGPGAASSARPSGSPDRPGSHPVRRGRRARRRHTEQVLAQVATRFDGSRRIVVLSRKGGVGKTTTTVMLGHTLAAHRGDRVVALDANPDAGSLGMRLPRETQLSATDLLAERSWVHRYAQIRAFTSQDPVTRLEVVASDDDPRLTEALTRADYAHLIDILDRHFTLLVVDTGTGVLDDAIQGVLEEADQLVVVVPPAADGARVAAMTLDWLDEHGHGALVASAVAVVNGVRGSGGFGGPGGAASAQLARIEAHFRERCASVHRIPWDPTFAAAPQASLGDLQPATRAAYLELAAAVSVAFPVTTRAAFGVGA